MSHAPTRTSSLADLQAAIVAAQEEVQRVQASIQQQSEKQAHAEQELLNLRTERSTILTSVTKREDAEKRLAPLRARISTLETHLAEDTDVLAFTHQELSRAQVRLAEAEAACGPVHLAAARERIEQKRDELNATFREAERLWTETWDAIRMYYDAGGRMADWMGQAAWELTNKTLAFSDGKRILRLPVIGTSRFP